MIVYLTENISETGGGEIGVYILLGLIIIAGIFITLILKASNISYSGTDSGEYFSSDVIDDDIDDSYKANDWNDVEYYKNDYEENNYAEDLEELELFDDMYD